MKVTKFLLGVALVVVPGSGIVYGGYLVYKSLKKKPKTTKEFIDSLKAEVMNAEKSNN